MNSNVLFYLETNNGNECIIDGRTLLVGYSFKNYEDLHFLMKVLYSKFMITFIY